MRRSFSSLAIPNYRRYFAGQLVSISGNWVQIVAETWLVLHLTGSGTAVGITAGLQFLPMLLAGGYGGVLADRYDKRRLLFVTQTLMVIPPVALWALSSSGNAALWSVWLLVLARGTILAVDNPTRQAFVAEIVGRDRVVNAVSLNSVIVHGSRIAGPALAAVLIATVGVPVCFLVNAASFIVFFVLLRGMNVGALRRAPVAAREPGQLREVLHHVWVTPALKAPLLLMALVGTLAFNFQVILPLLARFTFHGDASTYAALTIAMGVGAIAGALVNGALGRTGPRTIAAISLAFGVLSIATAAAPSLPVAMLLLIPTGAASVTFAALVNSSLQLAAAPAMRGRVMALYGVVFLGSTPIGGPLVGWLAQATTPRAGLVVGGAAALAGAGMARRWAAQEEAAPSERVKETVGAAPPCTAPTARPPARRTRTPVRT